MTDLYLTARTRGVKDVFHILIIIRSMLTVGILIVVRDHAQSAFHVGEAWS